MSTLVHDAGALIFPDARVSTKSTAVAPKIAESETPAGYRWVSRRWRVLPDGTRDYAAYHGKTAFSVLLPVSSKLKAAKS